MRGRLWCVCLYARVCVRVRACFCEFWNLSDFSSEEKKKRKRKKKAKFVTLESVQWKPVRNAKTVWFVFWWLQCELSVQCVRQSSIVLFV